MKFVAAIAAVIAAVVASSGMSATPGLTIYVENTSTLVSDQQIANALPAFQAALDGDFAPVWHADATLVQVPSGQSAPADSWTITVQDDSDIAGAAGYHKTCAGDAPCAFVFASAGEWELTFTHELWEMLVDPQTDRASSVGLYSANIYALEVADPVEDAKYAFTLPGADGTPVTISDFVTERWFDGQGGGAIDFMRHCLHAHALLSGGYIGEFKNGAWTSVYATTKPKVVM